MSQLNIKKTQTFEQPPAGLLGYGFSSNGRPVMINASGEATPLLLETEEEGQSVVPNIIANKGVGLDSALPETPDTIGDVYVAYDTHKVYTAPDSDTWSSVLLVKTQFVTDGSSLYQYNGVSLVELSGGGSTSSQNGFPRDQRVLSTISFVDATRVFSITPNDTSYFYIINGVQYIQTEEQAVELPDVSGGYVVYFDGTALLYADATNTAVIEDVTLNRAWVAYIYYNATTVRGEIVNDERHANVMAPDTHLYLHLTRGAQYLEGLAIEGIVLGSGTLDTDVQFGTSAGSITDEDLKIELNAVVSTAGFKYFYRTGVNGIWRYGTNAGFSFPIGANYPQFNQYTGGAWQLTEMSNLYIICLHVLALGDINGEPFVFLGTSQYANVTNASAGATDEIKNLLSGLPAEEFVPLYTLLIEARSIYSNTPKARIIQNADSEDYINWVTSDISKGSPISVHNNLSTLQTAQSGVTWGHITDASQTISGDKTFSGRVIRENEKCASAAITANATFQKVNFSGNAFSSASYILLLQAYAADGSPVPVVRGTLETDGFYVQVDFNCTLVYTAII